MPNRNSVNKPKHIGRKKPTHRSIGKTEVVTQKILTKKRAKKLERNHRYRQEYEKQRVASADDVDMETESKTQLKKALRAQKLLEYVPSEDVQMNVVSGKGTTLGGPAWIN